MPQSAYQIGGSSLAARPALRTRIRDNTQKPAHRVLQLIDSEPFNAAIARKLEDVT